MKHEHEADELCFVSRQTLGLMEPEVLVNVPQQSAGAAGLWKTQSLQLMTPDVVQL